MLNNLFHMSSPVLLTCLRAIVSYYTLYLKTNSFSVLPLQAVGEFAHHRRVSEDLV